MPHEIPHTDPEILWTATAERYIRKITAFKEQIGEHDPEKINFLNEVEATINELFPEYEENGKTIEDVEQDLKTRQALEENSDKKKVYAQILDLVAAKGL